MNQTKSEEKKVGLWNVAKSVGAAFFGVQSAKNRERDFTHGKASHYIIVGVMATLLFILGVWLAVVMVMRSAGV
jgi:hypothetical protein